MHEKIERSTPRYRVKDWYVFDELSETPLNGTYIREILDWGSNECQTSKLTIKQRHDIISELGLNTLAQELEDCFRCSNKPYDAMETAVITLAVFCHQLDIEFTETHACAKQLIKDGKTIPALILSPMSAHFIDFSSFHEPHLQN
jgi:hypothetical protein